MKVKQNVSQQLRRRICFIISVLFQRTHMWNKLFYLLYLIRHSVTWLNSRWWKQSHEYRTKIRGQWCR